MEAATHRLGRVSKSSALSLHQSSASFSSSAETTKAHRLQQPLSVGGPYCSSASMSRVVENKAEAKEVEVNRIGWVKGGLIVAESNVSSGL